MGLHNKGVACILIKCNWWFFPQLLAIVNPGVLYLTIFFLFDT